MKNLQQDKKVYIFKPLWSSFLNNVISTGKNILFIFTATMLIGVLIFHWPIIMLAIPLFLGLRIHLEANGFNGYDVDGYETIKIDCSEHFVYLDDLTIYFYDIEYAEVIFKEKPSVNWVIDGCGIGYYSSVLLNSEIHLVLKNGETKIIPIQIKGVLNKIVRVLKEFIVVKFQENNNEHKNESLNNPEAQIDKESSTFNWLVLIAGTVFIIYILIHSIANKP